MNHGFQQCSKHFFPPAFFTEYSALWKALNDTTALLLRQRTYNSVQSFSFGKNSALLGWLWKRVNEVKQQVISSVSWIRKTTGKKKMHLGNQTIFGPNTIKLGFFWQKYSLKTAVPILNLNFLRIYRCFLTKFNARKNYVFHCAPLSGTLLLKHFN